MPMTLLRRLLVALDLFVAIGATGGGIWGIAAPRTVPKEIDLERSPFQSPVIPGIILLVTVGGSCYAGAVALMRRQPLGWLVSMASGVILMVWIVVQVLMIGGGHFLQYLYFALGAAITALAASLGLKEGAEVEGTT
jgi:hypothetical protein